jgi:hypothetical protein
MRVFTSYFGKQKKLHEAGIVPVGISLWPPKYFYGTSLGQVAPKRYMLNDSLSEEEYTNMYHKDVLRYVDPQGFIKELERIGRGKDVALCCFESPDKFCHRHILAQWLMEKTGIEIVEFGYNPAQATKPEAPQVEQGNLFG